MTSIAIIVPVLGRPHRVAPLLESLRASDEPGIDTHPVFVCSAGDNAQIEAVRRAALEPLVLSPPGKCEYARKINLAVTSTDEEWLFLGADDLNFHPGWARAALDLHAQTGKLVIGTNDIGNPTVIRGDHATHSLVHRDYVKLGTIDDPTRLLHEGYDHNAVDVEFVGTAKARDQFAFCASSVVEHLHRLWGKAPMDRVYAKGMRNAVQDRRLYARRRVLWERRVGARR